MSIEYPKYLVEVYDNDRKLRAGLKTPSVIRLWKNRDGTYWNNILASFELAKCQMAFDLKNIEYKATLYFFKTYEEAYEYFILLCL